MEKMDYRILEGLEPISSLSPFRVRELAKRCRLEHIPQEADPFRLQGVAGHSLYLVKGDVELTYRDGNKIVITAASEWAKHPLGKRQPVVTSARALTEVDIVFVENDLLDIMVTWDQLGRKAMIEEGGTGAGLQLTEGPGSATERVVQSGLFSAHNIQSGIFAQLPPENVDELFRRIETVPVKAGEVVIREGAEGDYYYLVEFGRVVVTRRVGGVIVALAELKSGDAFGEEALISGGKRNATCTMKSDGVLLRLGKKDFTELLQEPLLSRLNSEQAKQKVAEGALWLDVRYPPEYQYDRLPGAINIPLNEIRSAIGALDKNREYVAYCQSGRSSAAAAFILAQRGYRIYVMQGGLRAMGEG